MFFFAIDSPFFVCMPGYSGPDEMNEIIANGLLLLLQEARELSHIPELFEPVHELYAFIRFSLADDAVFVDLRPELIQKLLPCCSRSGECRRRVMLQSLRTSGSLKTLSR